MTEDTNTLRGYLFVNGALSAAQRAVQSTHGGVELYHTNRDHDLCIDWAQNHKTLILLDGGYHGSMVDNYAEFSKLCIRLSLPHAQFYEDYATMNCLFTSFGGVIPSAIFDMEIPPEAYYPDYGKIWYDMELAMFLARFKLLT